VNIASGAIIGDNVKIQNNVSVYDGVIIEDDVFIGPSVVFTNVINPRAFVQRKDEFKKTIVRKGSSIGANATIVCGLNIGEYALVGAGSVVTKNVMSNEVVVGVPALVIGRICACGNLIKKNRENTMVVFECSRCNEKIH
jgi:UDP-2-acetamido-3-amino-2,3-dideoxy-glucuronate N-acetyltransferase